MKKIEDILAECIEEIKAGRTTLDECLAQYPAVRSQLEPLLKLAIGIQEPPHFKPSTEFKIRARVRLMEYIHHSQRKKSWSNAIVSGLMQGWRTGWLKTSAIVTAIVLVISASGTGTAYASQDSLPGDVLYPVKIATENIRRGFTFNYEAQIELELAFAGKRLEEIEALSEKRLGEIPSAIKRYEESITLVVEKAEENEDTGRRAERLEMVAREMSEYLPVIDGINDIVPTVGREPVQLAAEITIGAQVRVLRALALDKPIKAMEINYQAMQNRLKRASDVLDYGMVSEVENALEQFEEMHRFGQEISQMAKQAGRDTTVIDSLNMQAASERLEITNKMHGKAPDKTKPSAEDDIKIHPGSPGKGQEGTFGKDSNNNTDATSDNNSEGIVNPQEEPANPSGDPGNGNGGSGSPGGQPDYANNPGGPGDPPEDPGNGKN